MASRRLNIEGPPGSGIGRYGRGDSIGIAPTVVDPTDRRATEVTEGPAVALQGPRGTHPEPTPGRAVTRARCAGDGHRLRP